MQNFYYPNSTLLTLQSNSGKLPVPTADKMYTWRGRGGGGGECFHDYCTEGVLYIIYNIDKLL